MLLHLPERRFVNSLVYKNDRREWRVHFQEQEIPSEENDGITIQWTTPFFCHGFCLRKNACQTLRIRFGSKCVVTSALSGVGSDRYNPTTKPKSCLTEVNLIVNISRCEKSSSTGTFTGEIRSEGSLIVSRRKTPKKSHGRCV